MTEVLLARLDDITSALSVITGANVGSVGVGVFKQKSGTTLEFYKINPASTKVSFVVSGTDHINVDVVEANILLQNLGGALSVGQQNAISINNLTGDVATAQIENLAVTFGKIQNVAASRLLGNPTGGATTVSEISLAADHEFSGTSLRLVAYSGGDITKAAGANSATINNDAVTDAKLRNSAAVSVIGRSVNSAGDPADIAAGADDTIFGRRGSTLTFAKIGSNEINDGAITKAKIENVAADRLLGRGNGGGAGAPQEISLGTGLSMSGTTLNVAAGLVPIERKTGSSVASYDFTTGINSTYSAYLLKGRLFPATDDVELWLRTDSAGGASFDTGASDYKNAGRVAGSALDYNSAADTKIIIAAHTTASFSPGNGAEEGVVFWILIFHPSDSASETRTQSQATWHSANDNQMCNFMGGSREAAQADNALQLLFESGNIASGDVTLYGIINS